MAENLTFEIDPELIENEHIRITEDASGNLALEHKPSGNILTVDGNATISEVLQNGQNFDGEGTSNLTNLAAVETKQVGRGNGDLWNVNSSWNESNISFLTNPDDVSSTSYADVADVHGSISLNRIPAGATLYGNLIVTPSSVPTGETGTYALLFRELNIDGGARNNRPQELEVTVTDADNDTTKSSGWTEMNSFDPSIYDIGVANNLEAKVTGGTMNSGNKELFALLFEWRVD